MLQPLNLSAALMPEPVAPFTGAPQTVYSDHLLWPADGSMALRRRSTA